ncbi:MAG: hypothetical protein ACLTYW_07970 [Collinsella sp.]
MAKKPDSFYFDNYVACADLAVQAASCSPRFSRTSTRKDSRYAQQEALDRACGRQEAP